MDRSTREILISYRRAPGVRFGPLAELDPLQLEALTGFRRAGEQNLHRLARARLQSRRAGQQPRPLSTAELLVEDKQG